MKKILLISITICVLLLMCLSLTSCKDVEGIESTRVVSPSVSTPTPTSSSGSTAANKTADPTNKNTTEPEHKFTFDIKETGTPVTSTPSNVKETPKTSGSAAANPTEKPTQTAAQTATQKPSQTPAKRTPIVLPIQTFNR